MTSISSTTNSPIYCCFESLGQTDPFFKQIEPIIKKKFPNIKIATTDELTKLKQSGAICILLNRLEPNENLTVKELNKKGYRVIMLNCMQEGDLKSKDRVQQNLYGGKEEDDVIIRMGWIREDAFNEKEMKMVYVHKFSDTELDLLEQNLDQALKKWKIRPESETPMTRPSDSTSTTTTTTSSVIKTERVTDKKETTKTQFYCLLGNISENDQLLQQLKPWLESNYPGISFTQEKLSKHPMGSTCILIDRFDLRSDLALEETRKERITKQGANLIKLNLRPKSSGYVENKFGTNDAVINIGFIGKQVRDKITNNLSMVWMFEDSEINSLKDSFNTASQTMKIRPESETPMTRPSDSTSTTTTTTSSVKKTERVTDKKDTTKTQLYCLLGNISENDQLLQQLKPWLESNYPGISFTQEKLSKHPMGSTCILIDRVPLRTDLTEEETRKERITKQGANLIKLNVRIKDSGAKVENEFGTNYAVINIVYIDKQVRDKNNNLSMVSMFEESQINSLKDSFNTALSKQKPPE